MKKKRHQKIKDRPSGNRCRFQDDSGDPLYNSVAQSGSQEYKEVQVGMGRRKFLLASILGFASCLTGQVALARGRYCRPIKLGHSAPPKTLLDEWAIDFKKRLLQIDKKIEIKICPLQPQQKLIEGLQGESSGSFDIVLVSTRAIVGRIPEWRVLLQPALYPNFAKIGRLRHKGNFMNLLTELAMKKGAFLLTLGWPFLGIATSTVAIQSPAQMKGLKIRSWQEDWNQLIVAGGGTPVVMPYPEVSDAIKAGSIDGTIAWNELFKELGVNGVIKNLTWSSEHAIFSSPIALISNKWFWDKTGGDLQSNLLNIANESANTFDESYQKANIDAIQTIEKVGVKITKPNEDDFKKWVDLSKESAWKKYEEDVESGRKLIELAQKEQQ